ncbi:hypothetical protein Tcan_14666 [Toxocara canis]|nr:hypothetical protein Tcan_14666 [Toxocara canis]
MPACSTQCTQQSTAVQQVTQPPTYAISPSTDIPSSNTILPVVQQATGQCITACRPGCNTQCIENQQQLLLEPVPIQPQPVLTVPHSLLPMPLQPQTTQCIPPVTENECVCRRGFIVCITLSGSYQCCRKR